MKKFIVRAGFGLAVLIVIVLLAAVILSVAVVGSGAITRIALGFLVLALIDLALFANMLRRLPRSPDEEEEAGVEPAL